MPIQKSYLNHCLTALQISQQISEQQRKWMYHQQKVLGLMISFFIKGALSGLRKYLANENHLKMMKNVFYFTLKAPFVLKIFTILSFHVEKQLD